MKYLLSALGVAAILLGGLWMLQGSGVLRLDPILCVADCETVDGFAPQWVVAGLIVSLAGVLSLVFALRR